jgi:hypothetical protein
MLLSLRSPLPLKEELHNRCELEKVRVRLRQGLLLLQLARQPNVAVWVT